MHNANREQQADGFLQVERCIVELRRGREVALHGSGRARVVAALETIDERGLGDFSDARGGVRLLLTPQRAAALGLPGTGGPRALQVPAGTSFHQIAVVAGLERTSEAVVPAIESDHAADTLETAALLLARQARLLPALLIRDAALGKNLNRLDVSISAVLDYPEAKGRRLQRVSAARVPLANHDDCEFIVFREQYGDLEHVAILVGHPRRDQPVPVRLHSACLTGDLLDSLRCDCGEQLRGAVGLFANSGGGVVLYLAQEGRGIGLANKLRAYALQDVGLDTLEANRHLGFSGDERVFHVACAMLEDLGMHRIRLLTNNPHKIDALRAGGIDVVGRIALPVTVNPHNARYLDTKHRRAGHYKVVSSVHGCEEADTLF